MTGLVPGSLTHTRMLLAPRPPPPLGPPSTALKFAIASNSHTRDVPDTLTFLITAV